MGKDIFLSSETFGDFLRRLRLELIGYIKKCLLVNRKWRNAHYFVTRRRVVLRFGYEAVENYGGL